MSLVAKYDCLGRTPSKQHEANLQDEERLVYQRHPSAALPPDMHDCYNRLTNGNPTWEDLGRVLRLNFADRTLLRREMKHLMKQKLLHNGSAIDGGRIRMMKEMYDKVSAITLKRSRAAHSNPVQQGDGKVKEDDKYVQAAVMAFCLKVQAEMQESLESGHQGIEQQEGPPKTCELKIPRGNDQLLKDCLEKMENIAARHGLTVGKTHAVKFGSSQSQHAMTRDQSDQASCLPQQHTTRSIQVPARHDNQLAPVEAGEHTQFHDTSSNVSLSVKRRSLRNPCIEDPLYHVEVIAESVREGLRNRSQLSDLRSELEAEQAQVLSLQERNADLLSLKRQHECRIQELLHHNAIFACELASWKGIRMGDDAGLIDKLPSRDILGFHVERLLENPAFHSIWKRAEKRNADNELGGKHKAIKIEDIDDNIDDEERSANVDEE